VVKTTKIFEWWSMLYEGELTVSDVADNPFSSDYD
jgi:hypothetical protein